MQRHQRNNSETQANFTGGSTSTRRDICGHRVCVVMALAVWSQVLFALVRWMREGRDEKTGTGVQQLVVVVVVVVVLVVVVAVVAVCVRVCARARACVCVCVCVCVCGGYGHRGVRACVVQTSTRTVCPELRL
jgi:heme/copper-type cytochrome/quinol oxidase subunit 4